MDDILHFVEGHKYSILVLKFYITVLIMIWFNNEQNVGGHYNMFSCYIIALFGLDNQHSLPQKYHNESVIRWTGLTDHKWTMNLLCRLKITVGTKGSEEISCLAFWRVGQVLFTPLWMIKKWLWMHSYWFMIQKSIKQNLRFSRGKPFTMFSQYSFVIFYHKQCICMEIYFRPVSYLLQIWIYSLQFA